VIGTFTTRDGRTLSYERRGSGPLLVCHPGGPGGSAAEFRDLAGLDDTFELVLLSPRGSTGSDPADDYALGSYVSDLEALREHLGVEQLDLLGFSHGGIVAMAYAATHAARIRRSVLASTLAVWSEEAEAAMVSAIEARSCEPWFAEAAKALEEEQAGAFGSAEELVANVQRQIPLYFHHWEGNEQTGRELAADFAQMEPLHYFNTVEFPTLDLRDRARAPGRTPRDDPRLGPLRLHRAARCVPRRADRLPPVSEQAVAALRAGRAVILPTDTVYGLCALREDEDVLYELKGRDRSKPLALLAADVAALVAEVPGLDASVLERYLPGPYTLVMGGVGVRVPNLPPAAAEVVRAVGVVAATSANLSGGPDPRRVEDVPEEIRAACGAIVDAGELPGVPSTVIDLGGEEPRVLRQGAGPPPE
jgi:tRNA threonylcarbamoyl adenosine modification protein (Sua5/YciO/YrdC/YwlC family)